MTKAQLQIKLEEAQSTIKCLTKEKQQLADQNKHQKDQIDSLYIEINELSKDVAHLVRINRVVR
jgi:predicted nuclease with TOPRIM domain